MNKREFYKELKNIGFTQISLCTGEKTNYFFIDLPNIRLVIDRCRLYFRDVKDDNWINNIFIKEISIDDKSIKSLKKIIEFLGVEK